MSLNLGKLGNSDAGLLLAGAVALAVVYFVGKKVLTGAASAAGGVVSGNNALTAGTPYAGAGVAGTLGAAANSASGGVLSNIGGTLGDWLYNTFHPASATAQAAQGTSRQQVVTGNYVNDLGTLNSPNLGILDPLSSLGGSTSGVNGGVPYNFGLSSSAANGGW